MHTRRAVKTCFTLTSMFYNYAADIPKIRLLTIVGVTSYMGHWSKCPPPHGVYAFTPILQISVLQFIKFISSRFREHASRTAPGSNSWRRH